MKVRILYLSAIVLITGIATQLLLVPSVSAGFNPISEACTQAPSNPACGDAAAQPGKGDPINGDNGILNKVVGIIAVIAGIGATVMVALGGLKYITSGGDAQKVSAAKSQILAGLIGLVIIVASGLIMSLVIVKIMR